MSPWSLINFNPFFGPIPEIPVLKSVPMRMHTSTSCSLVIPSSSRNSLDFDSLLFGAPKLVRNMTITGRRKVPGKDIYRDVKTEMIESKEFLEELGITREQLVDMCILMGTDFNTGISGIGPKKGLKLIKDHGDIEGALKHLGQEIPEYQEVRDIFLHGHYSDDYDLKPREIDREATIEFLVDHDFSKERVRSTLDKIENARKQNVAKKQQRSLDAWF